MGIESVKGDLARVFTSKEVIELFNGILDIEVDGTIEPSLLRPSFDNPVALQRALTGYLAALMWKGPPDGPMRPKLTLDELEAEEAKAMVFRLLKTYGGEGLEPEMANVERDAARIADVVNKKRFRSMEFLGDWRSTPAFMLFGVYTAIVVAVETIGKRYLYAVVPPVVVSLFVCLSIMTVIASRDSGRLEEGKRTLQEVLTPSNVRAAETLVIIERIISMLEGQEHTESLTCREKETLQGMARGLGEKAKAVIDG